MGITAYVCRFENLVESVFLMIHHVFKEGQIGLSFGLLGIDVVFRHLQEFKRF